MREIKFRAYDDDNKEMVQVYGIEFWGNGDGIKYANGGEVRNDLIMQYTGLKDKNGKEIYEGDIVRGYAPDHERDERFDVMVIDYVEDAFALVRPTPPRLYFHDLASCTLNKSIEIIGNIYENPELLK